jgi:hypothetical protein
MHATVGRDLKTSKVISSLIRGASFRNLRVVGLKSYAIIWQREKDFESIYLWLYSPCWSSPLFQFMIYTQTVGLLGTGDQPVTRPLPTPRTTQTQNRRTQTSMPRVGVEPPIPVLERAKTVHALDRAAAVIGFRVVWDHLYICDVIFLWWLSSSGRWHRVALIRTDFSEDRIASIFRVHECEQVTERSSKLLQELL